LSVCPVAGFPFGAIGVCSEIEADASEGEDCTFSSGLNISIA
jgi:hypothetical protein